MYKKCVTELSSRRQKEIEQALLQVMATTPYEDITVSDLCAAINIPRKAFYRYFSGKDGALYALLDHVIMDYAETILTQEDFASIQTLDDFFVFWYEKRDLIHVLERNGLSGILIQRAIYLFKNSHFPPVLASMIQADYVEYVISYFVSGLISMLIQWHDKQFRESPHQMARIALDLMKNPAFK